MRHRNFQPCGEIDLDGWLEDHAERTFFINPLDGETLTFADVRRDALQIVRHLSSTRLEYSPGTVVFLLVRNPCRMVPALLACWRLGWIPALFDPATPPEKIRALSDFLGAEVALCDGAFPEIPLTRISLPDRDVTKSDETWSASSIAPRDPKTIPALLLFSSGTTGIPKCIPLSLRNIRTNIRDFADLLEIGSDDVFLCTSPHWYAHGLYNSLLSAFFLGAKVVSPGVVNALNAASILRAAATHSATVYHASPSMLSILAMVGKRIPSESLPRFRHVVSGTAVLNEKEKDAFESVFGIPVSQQYGMSESLIMTINHRWQREKPRSVGIPFGCTLEIRDENGKPQPNGVEGEVAVRTEAAFGRYFRQPEETEASYRDGWFYTGDLGILDTEGLLTITGRKKLLIKRGGINVSPREIDAAFSAIPGILEAVTVGIPDETYGEEIVVFVRTEADFTAADAELIEQARMKLPKTHVPQRIWRIDEFPKTASGKIALRELAEIAIKRS